MSDTAISVFLSGHKPGCMASVNSDRLLGTYHTGLYRGKRYRFTTCGMSDPLDVLALFAFEVEIRDKYWDIQPGDMVVDVGAGYGSYTLPAFLAGASMVVSFEPGREEFCGLSQNLLVNGWQGWPLCAVLSDRVGSVGFHPDSHSLIAQAGKPQARISVTLDWLVNTFQLPKLDWVKIDVEGAELAVIRGGLEALKTRKPKLLIEAHPQYVPDVRERLQEMLLPLGYKAEWIADSEMSKWE